MAKRPPKVEILRCVCKRRINDKKIVGSNCRCAGFDQKGQEQKINVTRFVTIIPTGRKQVKQ